MAKPVKPVITPAQYKKAIKAAKDYCQNEAENAAGDPEGVGIGYNIMLDALQFYGAHPEAHNRKIYTKDKDIHQDFLAWIDEIPDDEGDEPA